MPILILFDKGFANFDIVIITQSSGPKNWKKENNIEEKSEEESRFKKIE